MGGRGQGDYGDAVHDGRHEFAKLVAEYLHEKEKEFFIRRDVHHLDHSHVGFLRKIHEDEQTRRAWVDEQIKKAKDAEADRRSLRVKVLGVLSAAGITWLIVVLGEQALKYLRLLANIGS